MGGHTYYLELLAVFINYICTAYLKLPVVCNRRALFGQCDLERITDNAVICLCAYLFECPYFKGIGAACLKAADSI